MFLQMEACCYHYCLCCFLSEVYEIKHIDFASITGKMQPERDFNLLFLVITLQTECLSSFLLFYLTSVFIPKMHNA